MNDKKNKKVNGAGFYIALCCCVTVIGIIGYFTSRQEPEKTPQKLENKINTPPRATLAPTVTPAASAMPVPTLTPVVNKKEEKKVEETVNVSSPVIAELPEEYDVLEADEPEEFYEEETVESIFINSDPTFVMPTDGKICEKFSGDELIYNKAMGDWRTHNGIDIAAAEGTEVIVSSDGIIENIYTDSLGNTVIIDHKNGYKTKYSNLDNLESLTVGMVFSQGDFLAKIGSFNLGENTSEPHLHFEIIKDEKFVDPEKYIK